MSVRSNGAEALVWPQERVSRAWLLRDIIVPLLLTRLLLTLVGFVAINTMAANPQDTIASTPLRHAWLHTWARWDSIWYLRIARDGYYYTSGAQSSVAFFPLYPMMMKLGAMLLGRSDTGLVLSGVLVSNLWLLVALVWLWKLIAMDFHIDVARRAVMYVLVAPTTVFLSAAYPMSLILALATGAFYYARQARWGPAIFLAALAPLARPDGVLLAGGLAFEYFARRGYHWRELFPGVLRIVLPPVCTLAIWMAFLWRDFGDPLAFIRAQRNWESFSLTFDLKDWDALWGTLVLAACGVLLLIGWVKLRRSYMVWATTMWLLLFLAPFRGFAWHCSPCTSPWRYTALDSALTACGLP